MAPHPSTNDLHVDDGDLVIHSLCPTSGHKCFVVHDDPHTNGLPSISISDPIARPFIDVIALPKIH